MQSALKHFYVLISAYSLLAFFACPCLLTISTAIIHSQFVILLIYAITFFLPDPAFMNIFIVWEKSQILSQSNFKVWYWKGAGYQRCNCLENPVQASGSGLEQAQWL